MTAAPPPLGVLLHWALLGCRQAGEPPHSKVVAEGTPGAVRCELIVQKVSGECSSRHAGNTFAHTPCARRMEMHRHSEKGR